MMRNNLWIVGDSFAHGGLTKDRPQQSNWQNLLCKYLDVASLNIFALPGCDNFYLYDVWWNAYDKMDNNDFVVFVTTHPARVWWNEEYPSLTNLSYHISHVNYDGFARKNFPKINKLQFKAIQDYDKYCVSDNLEFRAKKGTILLNMLSSAVQSMAVDKNLRCIIIPAFEEGNKGVFNPYCEVRGTLCDVSHADTGGEEKNTYFLKQADDPRANHMSWENHDVLAKKIGRSLLDRELLDLKEDFVWGTIDTLDKWKQYK